MTHQRFAPAFRPAYWRLERRRFIRRIRRWEGRPLEQRKQHVLLLFAGLLALGGWSVSVNLVGQPPSLPRPVFTTQSSVRNQSTIQRTTYEFNRPNSTRRVR